MILKYMFKYFPFFITLLLFIFTCNNNKNIELNVGDNAPLFQANDQDGNLWRFQDHLGKALVVLYFYPAAMTGGCTRQACGYREDKSHLTDYNIEIVGISGDPVKNLKIFEQLHNLNYTLLSDINSEIAKKFGVPVSDGGTITMEIDGRETNLQRAYTLARWTFIIDRNGKIIYKSTNVDAENDSKNVIDFLKQQK
jgi:peroxiredoxin Q/BCP